MQSLTLEALSIGYALGCKLGVDLIEAEVEGVGGGALLADALQGQERAVAGETPKVTLNQLAGLLAATPVDEDVALDISQVQEADVARDSRDAAGWLRGRVRSSDLLFEGGDGLVDGGALLGVGFGITLAAQALEAGVRVAHGCRLASTMLGREARFKARHWYGQKHYSLRSPAQAIAGAGLLDAEAAVGHAMRRTATIFRAGLR